jgi:hypothetical protein
MAPSSSKVENPGVECAVDTGAGEQCFSNEAVFNFHTSNYRALEAANVSDLASPGSGSAFAIPTIIYLSFQMLCILQA